MEPDQDRGPSRSTSYLVTDNENDFEVRSSLRSTYWFGVLDRFSVRRIGLIAHNSLSSE
jgi:hypothetical protein